MILDESDIQKLTQKERHDAQARELDHLGIRYRARRDGSLVVFWADVHAGDTIRREPKLRLAHGPTP